VVNSNSRSAEVIWNYDRVELIADGIVHAIGVSLGLAGAIAIVVVATNSLHTADISSIVVYSVGLLSMLGFSAAYNTWPVSRAKWVLRRFDHSAIFLMIAGTYAPFIAQMKSDLVAMGLLIVVNIEQPCSVKAPKLHPNPHTVQSEQGNEYFLHHWRSGRDPCDRKLSRTARLKHCLARR
jgi:predicted membrane channel-forming protein YqfA (hemolysin III family)